MASSIPRVSQQSNEVLGYFFAKVRASQIAIEGLVEPASVTRVSQLVAEILVKYPALVGQLCLEVLVKNLPRIDMTTYPTLKGLSYSVMKRPYFSTGTGTGAGGREVRVQYFAFPLWEWDLTYPDYLPDRTGTTDFRQLIGFYLGRYGSMMPFQFLDPDDNTVVGQPIGVGDGVTTQFILVRSYGVPAGFGTEPIGMAKLDTTFNVYVDDVLQSEGVDYTVNTLTPVANYVQFNSAPAGATVITCDMTYYYWVRFKDEPLEFEKFMDRLWSASKVTLRSLRG